MGETLRKIWLGLQEQDPGPYIRRVLRVLAGLLMFLVALALYAPALGDARFIFGTDTVSHDYIMHYYGWVQSIDKLGKLPLWNPFVFSGLPMIGSAALCPFYPSQWLYFILPFNTAFTLQYVLAVTVGGIGAAWWMRSLGQRRSISLWAGLVYMVSGHFLTLTYAGHLQKMIALGWVPFALGATMQLVRLGRMDRPSAQLYRTTALLGLALGMQMLASHPQVLYATAAACFLQLVGMALTAIPWRPRPSTDNKPAAGISLKPVGQAIVLGIIAIIICCAVSAAQLFPTLEMSAHSNRAEGVAFTEAVETSYPPLEVFEYAIPTIFGDSVMGTAMPYFGKWGERIVSDYLGIPLMALAVIGLFGSRRRYRWFLLILLLAGLLIGLGRYTPLYWLLYHTLPGFDAFRSPGTYMFLSNCALVGLAAFGLDYLVNLAATVNSHSWGSSFDSASTAEPEPEPARAQSMASASDTQPFATNAVYTGTDTPPYNESIPYDEYHTDHDDPGYGYSYTTPRSNVASSNFMWDTEHTPWLGRPAVLVFIAAIALTALIGAIIALGENWGANLKSATPAERMSYHAYSRIAGAAVAVMLLLTAILLLRLRTWIGGVLVALVAFAFPLYHNYHFLKFEPLNRYMAHLTRQGDLLKLAKEAPQPVRLVEENLLKNEGMLYGIGSPAGYHPIVDGNYTDALSALGAGSDALGELFAVNYARTGSARPPEEGSWAPLDSQSSATSPRANHLWRRADPAPYIRNEADLVKVQIDDLSLTSSSLRSIAMTGMAGRGAGARPANAPYTARISDFDVRRYRLYEGDQVATGRLDHWTPNDVRLHVESAAPPNRRALLPLSEPYFPGWRAETSKRRQVPLLDVNGLQRGLVLPPGQFSVRMYYSPFALRLGLFVTLITSTILAGYGMASVTRRVIRSKKKIQKMMRQSAAQPGNS